MQRGLKFLTSRRPGPDKMLVGGLWVGSKFLENVIADCQPSNCNRKAAVLGFDPMKFP
jgi:hypothetical protein